MDYDFEPDRTIEPLPVVALSKIGGIVICGKRSGIPFANVQRPMISTGICPDGTIPCSNTTQADKTICYPVGQLDLCPVTQVFIANEEQGNEFKSNQDYTVLDLIQDDRENRYLVYSKIYDSLPIVNTVFNVQPCMDPSSTTRDTPFYPTENDRARKCLNDSYVDPEYEEVGYSISLYDLYQENGILSKL